MFESKINPLWQSFILAVQEEVKPALGCTEPISLALAAAAAAAELDGTVERIDAWVSPNLMKNGMGVTVPGTGMVGYRSPRRLARWVVMRKPGWRC